MKQYLLPAEGRFYKANLHTHSTISDGTLTPEEIKDRYKARGYAIVAFTDHNLMVPHPELADADFLPLSGFEYDVTDPDPRLTDFAEKRCCHLCLLAPTMCDTKQPLWHRRYYHWGFKPEHLPLARYDEEAPDFVREYSAEGINRAIATAREAGFFITYNHPAWSLESYPEYMAYDGFHALEVVNYSSLYAGFLDENLHVLRDMMRGGKRPFAVAADDNHNRTPDSFGGFTMIKAPSLAYADVFAALMKGDFYASEGPRIEELTYEDGRVQIRTSSARSITYHADVRNEKTVYATEDTPLTEATFTVGKCDGAFFLSVRDFEGKFAATRVYSIDALAGK